MSGAKAIQIPKTDSQDQFMNTSSCTLLLVSNLYIQTNQDLYFCTRSVRFGHVITMDLWRLFMTTCKLVNQSLFFYNKFILLAYHQNETTQGVIKPDSPLILSELEITHCLPSKQIELNPPEQSQKNTKAYRRWHWLRIRFLTLDSLLLRSFHHDMIIYVNLIIMFCVVILLL